MQILLLNIFSFCISFSLAQNKSNNVCKTFEDYYKDLENNPNCSYNPDIYLSAPEIIQRHGYPVENYTVTTQDGYILTVFRISHGKSFSKQQVRQPVFIQHGFGTSCMPFIDRGEKSLAFLLANNGYDVWLGNFRGTRYSTGHKTLKDTERGYWNFTFTELGIYDLPAQLNLVANKTKEKIIYIGYSMGTTTYYIYNSKNPEIAQQKLKLAISLAPVAFLHDTRTPYRILVPWWPVFQDLLELTTDGVIQKRTESFVRHKEALCLPLPIQMHICEFPSNLAFGFDYPQEDPETLPITIMQNFDAIGIKNFVHFAQLMDSGRFQEFDYGMKNKEVYGTFIPPQYNLSAINIDNYFIRGDSDPLATKKNVDKLYSALPKAAKPFKIYVVKYRKFTHMDFDSAKDVKELVYDHIVEFLKNYLKNGKIT